MAGVERERVPLVVVAFVVVALVVVVVTCRHRPAPVFVSPLVFDSPVYLPLVLKNRRLVPDPRFGIAEHGLVQMLLLGFPNDGRYHSVQCKQPEETDTVRFPRPAQRDHHSTWLLGTYDVEVGRWMDEAGFRRFVRAHDRMSYVVGNELGVETPIGDNNVTPAQFAQWYRDAWDLIKSENKTALVGPFAPVGPDAVSRLRDVWAEYRTLTGQPMPVDFFPLHWYARDGWTLKGEIAGITGWIRWLESYQGRGWCWTGEPAFWLTEYGRPEWERPMELSDVLSFMEGFTTWLKGNDLGIEVFVWWPSGRNTSLIRGTSVTPAGERYLQLALE